MALFPEMNTKYLDQNDRGLLKRMEDSYNYGITPNQTFWQEAEIDSRFEAGDQQVFYELYGNSSVYRKKQFNFNVSRPIIEMISGYQRRNRKSTIVIPIENGDNVTADQYTKVMSWINQRQGGLETISDAFHGALVTGMNLLHIWMDYRNDPISGDIRMDHCSYNSFLIDPYFRKADLSDCNFVWKRSYLPKHAIQSLLPDYTEELENLQSNTSSKDGKFNYMPENYNWDVNELLAYDEYYYRDYRTQTLLVDTQSGETTEWNGTKDELDEYLFMFPEVTTVENEIPTVNLAIVVEGKVIYNGRQTSGLDIYPIVPVFAYYNPQLYDYCDRIQGVIRSLRDPQFLFNRFTVNIADIVESQLNSGWIYKENAVVNPHDLFQTGNGKVISLKEEADMTDLQKIPAGEASQSSFQLTQMFKDLTMQVTGANEELMGSAVDEKAGVLSMLRQGAGLTTLQRLFDQLDYSQKLTGKIILQMVQNNFTPGKVQRIIEEQPTDQFYDKAFGTYDAAVEEGVNTTTQRQMQFAQFMKLRELGVPISDEDLIESATFQGKQKIIENMQKQKEEQAQIEQVKLQSQLRLDKANERLANANSMANEGLGLERLSRIPENKALAEERRADAIKNQDEALLDTIKALKEIQDIDLSQLEKIFTLDNIIKERQQAETQQQEEQYQPADPLQYMQALQALQEPPMPE